MAVTAEYSSETWAEFFEPTFNEFPELRDQLVKEFITYKQTGSPSDLLGRDAPFDFPTFASDANVHHIHLNLRYERTDGTPGKLSSHLKPLSSLYRAYVGFRSLPAYGSCNPGPRENAGKQ